ncbi:tether containing UBX domain for GLUT4-like [Montipora capricornis]|uniref:tether containing UBX domain for GLUT4-like n=1 Tax=Montipora capricornis TaxID=246305 RepID=UPI0035F15C0B
MAACKSVVVLCPNARRQTVKVNATTTILQVLEEVCKKQGLSSEQYALQNQRKILDDTLPIRYSGLSNNAHLELIISPKLKKVHTTSTVALQLESGDRLVKEFSASSSLWDVLCHWDSNQDSIHQGKILNPAAEENLSPVCIYMTQEIKGEEALKNVTLHSLGLTGKRTIIRLLHRQLEQQSSKVEKTETETLSEGEFKVSCTDPLVEVKNTGCATEDRTVNKPVVMSATSSSEGVSQFGLSTEVQRDVTMDDVNSSKLRSSDSRFNAQEGVKEPKRARISPPKHPFADFKFPEETAGMDLYQREQADSSRRDFLGTSCDRQLVIFSEEDPSSPKPDEDDQLPDSFFEVTVDDIRVMLRDLKNERNQADSAPLMTRAMREVREESEMYKYDRVVVRIKFPDRLILQAFFRPMEKVSVVEAFVKSHLEDSNIKFYLYTTPPRKVLDKQNSTLFENKLYPASVIHFGSQEKREHFLARRYVDNPSTVLDAEKAVIDNGVLSVRASARPDTGDSLVSSSTVESDREAGASSNRADRSFDDRPNPGAANISRLGRATKGTVPKWFKGTGK